MSINDIDVIIFLLLQHIIGKIRLDAPQPVSKWKVIEQIFLRIVHKGLIQQALCCQAGLLCQTAALRAGDGLLGGNHHQYHHTHQTEHKPINRNALLPLAFFHQTTSKSIQGKKDIL